MKNLYEIKLLPQIKIISSNPPQISTKNTLGGKIKKLPPHPHFELLGALN